MAKHTIQDGTTVFLHAQRNGKPGAKLRVKLGRASNKMKNEKKLTKCHSKLVESEMNTLARILPFFS